MLGAEAHAAVRAAQGAPEQLRIVATSTFAEFVAGPLMEAFRRRFAGSVEVTTGVAASGEQAVLIGNRLADVAFGPGPADEHEMPIVSEPIFKYRLVVVAAGNRLPRGPARSGGGWWTRLEQTPAARRPAARSGSGSRRQYRVFQSQTAAWAVAADGAGGRLRGRAPGVSPVAPRWAVLVDLPGLPVEECWHVTHA